MPLGAFVYTMPLGFLEYSRVDVHLDTNLIKEQEKTGTIWDKGSRSTVKRHTRKSMCGQLELS